jgi:formyltetrahydrofolate deformylase
VQRRLVLTITCPDRTGIVAAVTRFVADHGGWVLEAAQHGDLATGMFFQRIEILADSLAIGPEEFAAHFAPIADEFQMAWQLRDNLVRKRVLICVSNEEHCLSDLLHRWRSGDLHCEIVGVVSNHDQLRHLADWHEIPWHRIDLPPGPPEHKAQGFARLGSIIESSHADVVVLARFMQILPARLCAAYPGRIINIHHSFLPSFAGARPYHQAFERGVKLIGATCHYVDAELDAGPIIEQDVTRIDHGDTVEELMRMGRDIERTVLARALRWHLEDRVLLNGDKTVVFA